MNKQKASVKTIFKRLIFFGPPKDHIIQEMVRFNKIYEYEMLEHIQKQVLRGTYLDIGANLGTHGIFFATLPWVSKVHFFEPNPESIKYLNENIKINEVNKKAVVHEVGLGSQRARANIIKNLNNNLGADSLKATINGKIKIEALDELSIDEDIAVITIDVEGFEAEVLKGAIKTLKKYRPRLYVEARETTKLEELKKILKPLGYSVKRRFNYTPTYEFKCHWTFRLLHG